MHTYDTQTVHVAEGATCLTHKCSELGFICVQSCGIMCETTNTHTNKLFMNILYYFQWHTETMMTYCSSFNPESGNIYLYIFICRERESHAHKTHRHSIQINPKCACACNSVGSFVVSRFSFRFLRVRRKSNPSAVEKQSVSDCRVSPTTGRFRPDCAFPATFHQTCCRFAKQTNKHVSG